MEEHVLWIIGKGGRGIALFTSHVSLGIPQAGYAKQPCLKIPIALDMFSQKKETETEDSRVKNPALQRCERDQWGTGVFASGGRETPAFLALGCQVVGSAGRGHTCLVAPSTC